MTLFRMEPRRHRTAGYLGILALVSALMSLTVATPASADETIGISARPADAVGNPDSRTSFRYAADPGQRIDDNFLVTNTGTAVQEFTVVATDAFNDAEGDFALLATAEEPVAIGRWIRFDDGSNRMRFSLEPGASRVLPFTLELPADATPGDHVGGLVASVVTPGAEVNLDRRVASRIYTRVSGDLQPRLTISSIHASHGGPDWWNPFGGAVTMTYTVSNTGNIALAGNASGAVGTWFGIPLATASGGAIQEILPGNSATYEVAVDGIGQMLYLTGQVSLYPFVDSPDTAAQLAVTPTVRDTVLFAPPWTVLIALVVIAALIVLWRWRRRVDTRRAAEWIAYTEAEAARKAEQARGDANRTVGNAS